LSLDLELDDAQRAIADALGQFCTDCCDEATVGAGVRGFPSALWQQLAGLGVLALATPEGDGGACEAVAACEALGRAVFPGPLAATFFATQLLGAADRAAVAEGSVLVSAGAPPLLPFAPLAGIFLEIESGRVWQCVPAGEVAPVETLGGELWGRVELSRQKALGDPERAFALHDLTLAAYLAAAGQRLLDATAEHARTRKQFGRTLGEFQAVAHPLADCSMRLAAACMLARSAACDFDAGAPRARALAGAARLSAHAAAVEMAHTSHQLFGALGITTEGPVFHVSRRIRQLASQPPGEGTARCAVLDHFGLYRGTS